MDRALPQFRILDQELSQPIADLGFVFGGTLLPQVGRTSQHSGQDKGNLLSGEERDPLNGFVPQVHFGRLLASAM